MVIDNLKIISFENNIARYVEELVRLDALCLNDYGATWGKDNFLIDLPQKGQLSRLVMLDNRLVGFIVGSSYREIGHIHRLAVNPVFKQCGIATKLLKEFLTTCLDLGISQITVETSLQNIAANDFYQSRGFRRLEGQGLEYYLFSKDKKGKVNQYISDLASRAVYAAKTQELLHLREKGERAIDSRHRPTKALC